jgi:hypothetical protein
MYFGWVLISAGNTTLFAAYPTPSTRAIRRLYMDEEWLVLVQHTAQLQIDA